MFADWTEWVSIFTKALTFVAGNLEELVPFPPPKKAHKILTYSVKVK